MHKILTSIAIMILSLVLFALLPMTLRHSEIKGVTTSDGCAAVGMNSSTACGVWDDKMKLCFQATKNADGSKCTPKMNYMFVIQMIAASILFVLSIIMFYNNAGHMSMSMPKTPPYY